MKKFLYIISFKVLYKKYMKERMFNIQLQELIAATINDLPRSYLYNVMKEFDDVNAKIIKDVWGITL